jgi:pyruvate/2-oxoglutarate/acetoin dehydrogenase E1 component
MADIDEISQAIGRMEGSLASIKEELGYARLVRNEMANQLQTIPGLSRRMDTIEDSLGKTQRTVAVHEQIRQRGIGIVAVLALVFGVVGHAIWTVVEWFLSKH